MYTTTTAPRKRHRDSSSSPDSPPPQPRERSISPDRTSDFESLPAHLVGPVRKRRRKDGDAAGKGPFIRTGFERMALEEESDEEIVKGNGMQRQEEEFVDETPPLGETEFTFQPGDGSLCDTYRTRIAEGDIQGFGTRVVKPQSVEMPLSPDGDVSRGIPWSSSAMGREEGEMVEDVSDPEAGGIPSTLRGKNWYEPEKDRIIVTSLSDTESDTSPEPTTPPIDLSAATPDSIIEIPPVDRLTQPGTRGFTIHPTLLSRLNRMSEADRSRLPFLPGKAGGRGTDERGLILYRTPGRTFNGIPRPEEMDSDDEDSARFQVLPDEEAMSTDGMEVETEGEAVAAMSDVEVDESGIMEDVDSMEIG